MRRTNLCDECKHAMTHHPKQAGGRCQKWKDWRRSEACSCAKTQQQVREVAEAKRAAWRAELAARAGRAIAYRTRARVLFEQDGKVKLYSAARVQETEGGAWVDAQVWVPEAEIETTETGRASEVQS